MKNIVLITSLLLCGILFAQTNSFRNQATGSAIDDDLDLIYDPINLHFISGNRLYTNLSNIINGNEEFLNNNSSDHYLLGFSIQNPFIENLKHSFLVEFSNNKTGRSVWLDTNLDGESDIEDHGEIKNIYTSYEDIDGDGIYDVISNNTQNKKDYYDFNHIQFVLNNSTVWNDLVCGIRIVVEKDIDKDILQYDLEQSEYLLADGYNSFDFVEDDDLKIDGTFLDIQLLTSVMNPDFRGYELRGNLLFNYINDEQKTEDLDYDKLDNYDPNVTNFINYEENNSDLQDSTKETGLSIGMGGSLRKNLAKSEERKNDSYWLVGTQLRFGSYDYESYEKDRTQNVVEYYDGLDTLYTDSLLDTVHIDNLTQKGDSWSLAYSIYSRYNHQLDEKVYIGLGAKLYYTYSERTYKAVDEQESSKYYLQNDEMADENDYTITETYLAKSDVTREEIATYLTLPVGLEYKFTKNNKWAARLGASFDIEFRTINGSAQITDADPTITTTEYGDGTVDIQIDNNSYSSYSMQESEITSETDYYYGIGFEPTDKLQIDFAGMFDYDYATMQDFIQGIRMSFTMKF
jgi:hypothetical protein